MGKVIDLPRFAHDMCFEEPLSMVEAYLKECIADAPHTPPQAVLILLDQRGGYQTTLYTAGIRDPDVIALLEVVKSNVLRELAGITDE